MAKLSQIRSDTEKTSEGIWLEFAVGIRLKVARLHNPAYSKYLTTLQKPYTRQIRAGILDADVAGELVRKAVARHILVGWENIEDEQGKPIPYSAEKALEFLSDPALSEMYDFVLEVSASAELYRAELHEDSAKNLPSA